jgi:hypothetical protein
MSRGGPCNHSTEIYANYEFNDDLRLDAWSEIVTTTSATNPSTSTVNDDGYVSMKTPINTNRIVRQSKEYFTAKSYKINTALFTAVLNINTVPTTALMSVVSRIGVFDDAADKTGTTDLGFFFEYEINSRAGLPYNDLNGNPTSLIYPLKVGIRYNSTANALGDTIISQQSFNINDLNRHSHIQIDEWSKLYTFEIKYNAIGYVEWSIYLDGERIPLHKENNITRIINVLPHMNLPMRFEISNKNTGAVDATPSLDEMRQFSTSMVSDTGFSIAAGSSGIAVPVSNVRHLSPVTSLLYTINSTTYIPIFSIRLNAAFIYEPVKLFEVIYLIHKQAPCMYAIVRNGGPTTPTWVAGTTSRLDYDISSTTMTDTADIVYEDYIDPGNSMHSRINTELPAIASDIGGTPDIYTIVVRKMGTEMATANFSFRWVE